MFQTGSSTEASDLWGVRASAVIIALCGVFSVLATILLAITAVFTVRQRDFRAILMLALFTLASAAVSYGLIVLTAALHNGTPWARAGAVVWGIFLLLFCWLAVSDARGPYNPKAPDAQELDGPAVILVAPLGLWLCGYMTLPHVRRRFSSSRVAGGL
jgi:hypothetical protein